MTRNMAVLVTVGSSAAVFGAGYYFAGFTDLVRFSSLTVGEFGQQVMPLFLTTLIVERTVEVFISGWRDGETRQREAKVASTKSKAVEVYSYEITEERDEGDRRDSAEGDGVGEKSPYGGPLIDESQELARYKAETRLLAFLVSVVLGAIVAVMGVRALGMFVDPGEFEDLREAQRRLFHALDVVLTTGLIAGGSDGFHQFTSLFTTYLKKTKENVTN